MIDQMSDFIKGRTTVTSRIEEVKSLEPPTVTVCFYPPYKQSKLIELGITNPYDKAFNTSFEERINSMSYSLGQDLSMNLTLSLGYDFASSRSWTVPTETDSSFNMQPVISLQHGKCYKFKPNFNITSNGFGLKMTISTNSTIDQGDIPSISIFYLTSSNTWQGLTSGDWPQFTPTKVELDITKGNGFMYVTKPVEYLFDQGVDNSEECWKKHLMKSNCTVKCVTVSVTDLPMCKTQEERNCFHAFANRPLDLWTFCNLKKYALTYPGELTLQPPNPKLGIDKSTTIHFRIFSLRKMIKEEILVISLPDLIGSLGGSLGMFFGFSISAYVFYLLDKLIVRAMKYRGPNVI